MLGLMSPLMAEEDFTIDWNPKRLSFLVDEVVTFDATFFTTTTPIDVFWQFQGGDPIQGRTIQHRFAEPGLVEVEAYGKDASGDTTRVHYLVFIVQPQFADINFNAWIDAPEDPHVFARAGSELSFHAWANVPAYFLWQLGDWGVVDEGETFTWQVPQHLDGFRAQIRLLGINEQGAGVFGFDAAHQRELFVYLDNHPPRTAFAPATYVDGQTVVSRLGHPFTVRVGGTDPDGPSVAGFLWVLTAPDGTALHNAPLTRNSLTFQPAMTGIHELDVYAIDQEEDLDPFGVHLRIDVSAANRPPTGSFSFLSGPVLRLGERLEVEAQGSDPESTALAFRWEPGDGRELVTGRTQFTIGFDAPGAYPLALTVLDQEGGESVPFYRWVFVNATDVPENQPPMSWIVTPRPGATFQAGEAIDMTAWGFDADGDRLFYFWDFDDGTIGMGDQIAKTYKNASGERPWAETFEPHLFVRDDSGVTDYAGYQIPIAVVDGFDPPDGRILQPDIPGLEPPYNDWRLVQLRPGGELILKGEILSPLDGLANGVWRFIKLDEELHKTDANPVYIASGLELGPLTFEEIPQTGFYLVDFSVVDAAGYWDPTPDTFLLWVRQEIALPEVTIAEPVWDRSLRVGEPFHLAAWGTNTGEWGLEEYVQFLDLEFRWTLSDGRTFQGQRVEFLRFEEPGLYWATLTVTNSAGESYRVPERRNFVVNPQYDPVVNVPPQVEAVSPLESNVLGPKESAHQFACQGSDIYGEAIAAYLWDFGNGTVSHDQIPDPVRFDQPGSYLVRAYAQDASGYWSEFPHYWQVYIYDENVPPQGTIIQPELRDHDDPTMQHVIPVLMGQDVMFEASAVDRDSPTPPTIQWLLDGVVTDDEEVPRPAQFPQAGEYLVQLMVTDAEGLSDPFADWRLMQVVDPERRPESHIAFPDRELVIDPGRPLYFFGYGEDPNHLELTYEWDFGPFATPSSATGYEVYPVVFNQESPPGEPYVVSFRAKTQFTQDETPATVRITVRSYQDSDFEPNDSFEQIKPIQAGRYPQMRLGPGDSYDFFQFDVSERSRDFEIELWTENPGEWVVLGFFGKVGDTWLTYALDWVQIRNDTIRLQDLPTGTYAVVIALPDEMKKRAEPLSYGIGLNTLQPSFYLPFLVEDGNLSSYIGMINPHDTLTDVAVVGLDAAGETVESVSFAMAPHTRMYVPSRSFFGNEDQIEKARMIHWVKILSTQRLVGFMNAETQDKRQLMSTPAITTLTSSVLVPHVAEKTEQWYTRAVLVNADETSHQLSFKARDAIQEIASPAQPNSQEDLLFTDLYAEDLPLWGEFVNGDGQACLAGIEVFGRNDGNAMMAGLEMINPRMSNPNFLSVTNTIFFPHVASDVAQFWTGLSMVNPSDRTVTFNLIAYDDAGGVCARLDGQALEPGGKFLATASDTFPDVAGISWIKVEGDADLTGFELFGDHNNKRLAGFKAQTYGTDQLFFPHVQEQTGRSWTGISVLNFGTEAAGALIRAYNDQGILRAEREVVLAPMTKLVATVAELFPGQEVPGDVTYVQISSDQKTLNGFEIFGSLNQDGSLGEQMAGLGALSP